MRIHTLTMFVLCLLSSGQSKAATNVLTTKATSRSVVQNPLAWFAPGVGALTTFTTTFDGSAGLPMFDAVAGDFSHELRPKAGQPNTFEADYINVTSTGLNAGYGSANLTLATGDSDGNLLPDIFEFEKAGSVTYAGFIDPDSSSVGNSITAGTLTKSANSGTVQNTFTARDPSGAIISFNGTITIGYFSGTGAYTRGTQGNANTLEITLTGGIGGPSVTYQGTTTFTVLNTNQISIPAFTARRSDGFALSILAFTANRTGKKYFGEFEAADGNLTTSWRDYTKWVLEFSDNNDADSDGIPDLSDAPNVPPAIVFAAPLQNQIIDSSSNFDFRVTASDSDGSVVRVDYFLGATLLGSTTAPPFTYTANILPLGAHVLSAVATDNAGATNKVIGPNLTVAARASVNVTVPSPGRILVRGTGTPNVAHTLQTSTNAVNGTWSDVATASSTAQGAIAFPEMFVLESKRFYRAIVK